MGRVRSCLIASVALAAACSSSHPAAATSGAADVSAAMSRGVVYVADDGGRVLAVNLATGKKTLISANAKSVRAGGQALMTDVDGISREADGNFVVISRRGSNEDTASGPHSRLIRINAKTGAESLILSSPKMHYGLVSVAVAPGGQIYYGDEATSDGNYNAGAVWRVDPGSGALSLATDDAKSVKAGGTYGVIAPLGIAFESANVMYVLADNGGDTHATGPNDNIGAILRVALPSGKMTLVTSNYYSKKHGGQSLFHDPRAFVRAPNGDFYVVDDAHVNIPSQTGDDTAIIKVDHTTGAQTLVSSNAKSAGAGGKRLFDLPYGIAIQPDGQLLVVDGDRLLRINPSTGAQTLVTSGLGDALSLTF